MKYLLLLGLVVVVSAQVPTPCESPKQWEGRVLIIDQSKNFTVFAGFAYDETFTRTRVIEEVREGVERNFYDTLTLYGEGKEYRVDLRSKKCNTTVPTGRFRTIGVPRDAKFLFMNEVGAAQIPNEHFTAATFGGNFTEDNVRYATTVTLPDCVPIGDNYYNDKTGFIERRFFDVKLGIANPEAFLPPRECM